MVVVRRPLADAEDNVLSGFERRDAHQADEAPLINIFLGHRRVVAADEKGFVWLGARQRPCPPEIKKKVRHRLLHLPPQALAIRFKDDPLYALRDRLLEKDEQPTDVHVSPFRIV